MRREQDLRNLGATEAQIQEMLGNTGADEIPVWPENWQALEVFLACSTQWRYITGYGGVVCQGLDYPAVESILRLLKIDNGCEMLNALQVMEIAALPVLNRK